MVETTRTQKAPVASAAVVATLDAIEFSMPLREVEVMIMGKQKEFGLLDEGSEIVILSEDLRWELGAELNTERQMWMQMANGEKEAMLGCVEYLELEVGGVKTYVHAFVVSKAPYRLLLGRPWQKGVKLGKVERADGSMDVVITDPGEEGKKVVVVTRERKGESDKAGFAVMERMTGEQEELMLKGGADTLTETML